MPTYQGGRPTRVIEQVPDDVARALNCLDEGRRSGLDSERLRPHREVVEAYQRQFLQRLAGTEFAEDCRPISA